MKIIKNKENIISKYISLPILLYISSTFLLIFYSYCNTEDYASLFSAMIAKEYYPASNDFFWFDVNLFILPLISFINSFVPGVQVFGYYLFFTTFLIGIIYIKVIDKQNNLNTLHKNIISYIFIIIQTSNFISLSSTRVAVLSIALFFFLYFKEKTSKSILLFLFLLCIIIRVDALALLSVLYIIICTVINKEFTFKSLLPFIGTIIFLIIYNSILSIYASEAIKSFYYYELELMDHSNFNIDLLNKKNKIIISLLRNYLIFDKSIFKISFLKNIISIDSSHISNVILNPKLYINTLKNSIEDLLLSYEIITISIILTIFSTIKQRKIIYFIILLFPLVACLYISLPLRFIVSYNMVFIIYMIAKIKTATINKYKYSVLLTISVLVLIHNFKIINIYNKERESFETSIHITNKLKKLYGEKLYFENFYYRSWRFTTTDINYRYTNNQFHFINFGYAQMFESYSTKWKDEGCKNPLSIPDKINHIIQNGNKIIVDDIKYEKIYSDYLKEIYNYNIKINYIIWPKNDLNLR